MNWSLYLTLAPSSLDNVGDLQEELAFFCHGALHVPDPRRLDVPGSGESVDLARAGGSDAALCQQGEQTDQGPHV